MATRRNFALNGVPELTRAMEQLGEEVSTKAGQLATRRAANVIRDAAKASVPVGDEDTSRTYTRAVKDSSDGSRESVRVDYGHGRDNIKVKKGRARKAHTVVSLVTTGSAFWLRFLEFGTEKMAARPWFKPAIDGAAQEAVRVMIDALAKALKRAARKAR